VVCNGLTGELLVMSCAGVAQLDALREGRLSDTDEGFVDVLRARDLVYSSPDAEHEAFGALCRRSFAEFEHAAPRHFTLVVTTHCNFDCPYCFEDGEQRQRQQIMTADDVDAAFAVIDAASTEGAPLDLEVFGGEPLLPANRATIERILDHLAARRGQASIQTNGSHLASYVELFQRYATTVAQIQVTLDGPQPIHDRRRILRGGRPTFATIVAGINAVAASDLPAQLSVRMNVDRGNIDALDEMVAVYRSNGWTEDPRFSFVAAPVDNRSGILPDERALVSWAELLERLQPRCVDSGGGPFDLSIFKVLGHVRHALGSARMGTTPTFVPKVNYCEAAALKLFVFHPDGYIYPCPEAVGRSELSIGTYRPQFELDAERCALWTGQTILERAECRDCPISTLCGGGCVLAAIEHHGTPDAAYCEGAPDVLATFFDQFADDG
jgi:uncharacterized protein